MDIDEQMSKAIEIYVNPVAVQTLVSQGANKNKALQVATEYKAGLDNATNNGPEDLETIANLEKIINILKASSGGKSKRKRKSKSKNKRCDLFYSLTEMVWS